MGEAEAARGERPWSIVAPSPEPVAEGWLLPDELGLDDIRRLRQAFAGAARRALEAGFEAIEVHGAHGYLNHSFLSPLSNRRNDAYGDDRAGRMRFPLEVAEAVRRQVGITTIAVGLITEADQAEAILEAGQADLIALARELLYNPNWPLHAARELGVDPEFEAWPPQHGWWLVRRAHTLARASQG